MSVVFIREPRIKELWVPEPDGVNTDFETSGNYKFGTVSIWLNGIRIVSDLASGFTELGGKTIRMKELPLLGDTLHAMYEAI